MSKKTQLTLNNKREGNMRELIQAFVLTQILCFGMWDIPIVFITCTLFNIWLAIHFKPLMINKKRES